MATNVPSQIEASAELLAHAASDLISAYENGGDDARPLHSFIDELCRALSDFNGVKYRAKLEGGGDGNG